MWARGLTEAETVDDVRLSLARIGVFSKTELVNIPLLSLTTLTERYISVSAKEQEQTDDIYQNLLVKQTDEFGEAIKRLSADPYSFVFSVLNQPDRVTGEFAAALQLRSTKRIGKMTAQIWAGMFCQAGIEHLLHTGKTGKRILSPQSLGVPLGLLTCLSISTDDRLAVHQLRRLILKSEVSRVLFCLSTPKRHNLHRSPWIAPAFCCSFYCFYRKQTRFELVRVTGA